MENIKRPRQGTVLVISTALLLIIESLFIFGLMTVGMGLYHISNNPASVLFYFSGMIILLIFPKLFAIVGILKGNKWGLVSILLTLIPSVIYLIDFMGYEFLILYLVIFIVLIFSILTMLCWKHPFYNKAK